MIRTGLAIAFALLLSGCGIRGWVDGFYGPPKGPQPDLSQGVEVVDQRTIIEFQTRAQAFYSRLSRRRFNTFATYSDAVLRDHFLNREAFYDYYADLAHDLDQVDFERNRAVMAQVKEFAVEGPGRARVAVRMRGDNGLPLRFWTIVLEREDVWERVEGAWWVVPGKL